MKKRLHDKKAGIAILISLIIISLAEVIFRAVAIGEAVLTTANLGEQLAVIALAAIILILTAKGKDRACYILYGAWIAYFVLDQLFELPNNIINMITMFSNDITLSTPALVIIAYTFKVLSSIGIIAIGGLLVEYMCDGTICNRLFNILCVVTAVMILCNAIIPMYGAIVDGLTEAWLGTFHDLYRLAMIFLFTFFAYDSAKAQLKKTNLTK